MSKSSPAPPYAVMPTDGSAPAGDSAKAALASMTSLPAYTYGLARGKIHSSSSFSASGIFVNGSNGFGPNS